MWHEFSNFVRSGLSVSSCVSLALYVHLQNFNHSEFSSSRVKLLSLRSVVLNFGLLLLNCWLELDLKLICDVNKCNIRFKVPPADSFLANFILKSRLSKVARQNAVRVPLLLTKLLPRSYHVALCGRCY